MAKTRSKSKPKWSFKKFIKFIRKNYFLSIIVACLVFIGLIAAFKIFSTNNKYIYLRVKVGAGYWWATTAKPTSWLIDAINIGDKKYTTYGDLDAQVLDKRVYPAFTNLWSSTQNDLYLTIKVKTTYSNRTKYYLYNRIPLVVGSPVEFQFPSADITGNVIELSNKPFKNTYVEKIIYLVYQNGYSKDFTYRYDNIKVGDSFFDGKEVVFKVLDKWLEKNIINVQNNLDAQLYVRETDISQNIVVKALVKVKIKSDGLYYNEDYKLYANAAIPFSTSNYYFENFVVRKVE